MKVHLEELQILAPIRRDRAVAAYVFEVPDGVEDASAGRRHLIGVQPFFPEQPKYPIRRYGCQKLPLGV